MTPKEVFDRIPGGYGVYYAGWHKPKRSRESTRESKYHFMEYDISFCGRVMVEGLKPENFVMLPPSEETCKYCFMRWKKKYGTK